MSSEMEGYQPIDKQESQVEHRVSISETEAQELREKVIKQIENARKERETLAQRKRNPLVLHTKQEQIVLPEPENRILSPGVEVIRRSTPPVRPYEHLKDEQVQRFDKEKLQEMHAEMEEMKNKQDELPKPSVFKKAQERFGRLFRRGEKSPTSQDLGKAMTMTELISMTTSMSGELQGSKKAYSGVELAGLLREVQSGRQPIESITSAGGLRTKASELLRQEQQR